MGDQGVGPRWIGVDVGGRGKGFDLAVVDERGVLGLAGHLTCAEVVATAISWRPVLIGIDSPRRWAPDGEASRADERALNRAVCAIRWTPDQRAGATGDYYGWVREGLALYDALDGIGLATAEVFPTAAWTRWSGPRGKVSRALWSTAALASLGLAGVPARTNQDQRDAIAAAVTARQHTSGQTESFGEIVVPRAEPIAARSRVV